MKIKIVFFTICVLFNSLSFAQIEKLNNLTGKWNITGKWKNGDVFKQSIETEWSLGNKILKSKTFGLVNPKSGATGLRSEGIRAYNQSEERLEFWEFDISGGIIEGLILIEENKIIFEYSYTTGAKNFYLRDVWEKISPTKYKYSVLQHRNGKWNVTMIDGFAEKSD